MATRSRETRDRGGVSPALIAVSAALLLVFIGWLAYANLFAPPKPAPMDQKAEANHEFIKRLAKQSGGDMSKISPEDRQKLEYITSNHGALALQAVLKEP